MEKNMSNRFSDYRNSSAYSNHFNNSHRPPLQRYGAGIAMVLLVHAGAIVAIKSGLDIRKLVQVDPPLVTKTIPIPPPVEKPIEKFEPTLTDFTLAKPQEPALPQTAIEIPAPADTVAANTVTTTGESPTTTEPPVTMVRIDPRHPLTQPTYPLQSRRLGEEGSVELLVFVLPNGRVGEARVAVGSGYARLDEAAMREALRNWRFLPNTVDGVATGSWNRVAITFRLKN
jgi:protein TonB